MNTTSQLYHDYKFCMNEVKNTKLPTKPRPLFLSTSRKIQNNIDTFLQNIKNLLNNIFKNSSQVKRLFNKAGY